VIVMTLIKYLDRLQTDLKNENLIECVMKAIRDMDGDELDESFFPMDSLSTSGKPLIGSTVKGMDLEE
jgi:hypothetical protein